MWRQVPGVREVGNSCGINASGARAAATQLLQRADICSADSVPGQAPGPPEIERPPDRH
jgi:hypothetical protein